MEYALYSEKLSFCYSKLGLTVDSLIGFNFVIFLLTGHILNFKNITRNRVYFCIYKFKDETPPLSAATSF